MQPPLFRAIAASLALSFTAVGSLSAATQIPVQPTPQRPAPPRDAGPRDVKGTAVLKGRVVAGENGKPLRRARITVRAPELGPEGQRTTSTNLDGRYEFKELPAGRDSPRSAPGRQRTWPPTARSRSPTCRPVNTAISASRREGDPLGPPEVAIATIVVEGYDIDNLSLVGPRRSRRNLAVLLRDHRGLRVLRDEWPRLHRLC